MVILVLSMVPRIPLPTGGFSLFGNQLTEEVNPPQVLYASTINLNQGTVWKIEANIDGIRIEQKSSQLIEKLVLEDVDLAPNDVVSMHLFGAYVAPSNTVGANYVYLGDVTPYNGSYTMVMWAKGNPTDSHVSVVFDGISGGYFGLGLDEYGYVMDAGKDPFTSESYNHPSRESNIESYSVEFALSYDYDTNTSYYIDPDEEVTITTIRHGFGYKVKLGADCDWDDPDINARSQDPSRWGYFILYTKLVDVTQILQRHIVTDTGWWHFFDATWFNGTHYLDIKDGTPYQVVGTVTRIPAKQTWLWLIKSLTNDNKLHVKFVPEGSVFRIKYSGMIYEWRIDGEPNAVGLIEDYSIDIASIFGQTVLPSCTVELIYPSQKVRFYVPSGFQVVVEGNGWSETHEVPLNSSYVDFGLPFSGTYTVKILGYEETPRIHVETSGDLVRVTVTDEAGYALAGAKVYVYDASGNLAAVGVTNDLGFYEFSKEQLSGEQARIVVVHLSNGKYFHADKLVSLTASMPSITSVPAAATTASSSASSAALAIILLLGIAVLTIMLVSRRKR
ncbi:MAG: hypothetical protein DRO12_05190 [Thermoprotei archaeon]|nr:MAG: hypothetical protein DRO12_05190 [Thermoprotei archaeon]